MESWRRTDHFSFMEDEFAEIAVCHQENPLLLARYCKDILTGEARRVIARYCRNVMAEMTEVADKSEIGALVEQEPHRAASLLTPLGGFGKSSSPITTARAYARQACTSSRVRSG